MEVLENAWFRKVSGRFPEYFPEEIATSKKRRVPEDFRKVPGRFPGRAKHTQGAAADLLQPRSAGEGKTTAGEPEENAKNVAGNFPEDFRKIPGRATPGSHPQVSVEAERRGEQRTGELAPQLAPSLVRLHAERCAAYSKFGVGGHVLGH